MTKIGGGGAMVWVRSHIRAGKRVRAHSRSVPGKQGTALFAGGIGLVLALQAGAPAAMTSAATTGSASILTSTFKARSSTVDRIIAKMVMKELRGRNRAMDIQTDCAGHSYGQVQEFFESTPCLLVFRAALEVRDKYKNAVIVAVSWVEMPDPAGAAAFKELVDTHGTGNVTELSDDVAFSGHHYTSRLEGTTVINVQAEPVGAAVPAAVLAEIAATAVGTD